MKERFLPNKKYYHFSTSCYCGVVVDEKTMKRIEKVLYRAEAEVKNILHTSEDVRPYSWSLVNIMDGNEIKKQKTFSYTAYEEYYNVNERINNLKIAEPQYLKDFYEIKSDEELEELKECLLKELAEEMKDERI